MKTSFMILCVAFKHRLTVSFTKHFCMPTAGLTQKHSYKSSNFVTGKMQLRRFQYKRTVCVLYYLKSTKCWYGTNRYFSLNPSHNGT